MSKKSNTTLIGLFLVSGLALFIAAIFVFSSARIFTKKLTFYVFFDASLNGLDVGAPVKFKGVKVGNVESIETVYSNELSEVSTAVIFNVNTNLFKTDNRKKVQLKNYDTFYFEQINRGLAAKLSMESILTGKLYVGLDYYPNRQARFANNVEMKKCKQMPSVPTELEEFMASFDAIMQNFSKIEFGKLSKSFLALSESFREKIKGLDLSFINNAMGSISEILSLDSPTRQALDSSLQQLSKTLRSLRVLLEYLERNPNALFAGKAQ